MNSLFRNLALSVGLSLALTACGEAPARPPGVVRIAFDQVGQGASEPLPSPDTTGAAWVMDGTRGISFARPGSSPFMTLSCVADNAGLAQVRIVRQSPADPHARAMLALIGNRRIARIKIDAVPAGKRWLWQASLPADDPQLDGLAGYGSLEATIPGAGTLKLAASDLPGQLIEACRRSLPQG